MNYSKHGTEKKQKKLVSRATKNKRKATVILFKTFLVCIVGLVVGGVGAGFGMLRGVLDNAPDIDDISVQPEGFKTTVYNQNGEIVTTLSTYDSNRVYAEYADIPEDLRNAFVAIEDERFWEHNGIDVKGIGRAFFVGVQSGHFSEGASTLTQQLIKNQVFNTGLDDITFMDKLERKIQEQYLAIELEKRMTKEQILEYYLNTIYLGQGVHGIEAASNKYFNKSPSELTISECAVIASITQNPYSLDPTAFPEDNAKRQKIVLKYMKEQGYITEAEYNDAIADDVYARIQITHDEQVASAEYNSYFIDAVITDIMKKLQDENGYTSSQAYNALYRGGLSIYITQDENIQEICDDVLSDESMYPAGTDVAVNYALSIALDDGTALNYDNNKMLSYFKNVTGNSKYTLIYSNADLAKEATEQFKNAMLEESGGTFLAESFSTTLQPQTSFVLMDQATGYVKAIVGGRGEKTGNLTLNRATSSERQPGSTFKILSTYVPALDTAGMTLATVFDDAQYNYLGGGREVKNWWGDSYRGLNTIRTGIRDSMNVIAVQCLAEVTPQVGYDYLCNMGITTLVEQEVAADGTIYSDIQQSLALGGITNGVTNLEMTAAYASIANQGIYTEPILYTKVLDHDGNVLIDNTPETRQVMKDSTAWLINNAMKDVITSGTGGAASLSSGMPVSGKTGTTSSNYDLWFCASTPYYTASIWMGYDTNTAFNGEGYHERIWAAVMNRIVESEEQAIIDFPSCSNITTAQICTKSGMLSVEGLCDSCEQGNAVKTEYFATGTVPTETCTTHVKVSVCEESGLPATEFCPKDKVKEIVYIVRPEDSKGETADTPYELPDEFKDKTCNIHTHLGAGQKYTITTSMSPAEGGTITSSPSVNYGERANIQITPNTGYILSDVKVDGNSVGAITNYVFENVTANHTLVAEFKLIAAPEATTEASTTTTAP